MNAVIDCMVSLSPLEILCFFLAGTICGKEENSLLVLRAGQSSYNTENRVFESTALLQSRSVHIIFNRCLSNLFLKACRDGNSLPADNCWDGQEQHTCVDEVPHTLKTILSE